MGFMSSKLSGMLLWIVPAVFGAYFLYRLVRHYAVEGRVVYRCLLLVVVSVVLIALYV